MTERSTAQQRLDRLIHQLALDTGDESLSQNVAQELMRQGLAGRYIPIEEEHEGPLYVCTKEDVVALEAATKAGHTSGDIHKRAVELLQMEREGTQLLTLVPVAEWNDYQWLRAAEKARRDALAAYGDMRVTPEPISPRFYMDYTERYLQALASPARSNSEAGEDQHEDDEHEDDEHEEDARDEDSENYNDEKAYPEDYEFISSCELNWRALIAEQKTNIEERKQRREERREAKSATKPPLTTP